MSTAHEDRSSNEDGATKPIELAEPERILVRYGELALKGGNRRWFERRLMRNLRAAVASISPVRFEMTHGRVSVVPEQRTREVARRAAEVFGIKSVSPAWGVDPDPEAIAELADAVYRDALLDLPPRAHATFCVRVRRADKSFPYRSSDFERSIADRLLASEDERIQVQLKNPDLELGIEVRAERTYVYLQRHEGPGGLPVGTLGKALCLLSGGIDSPVAAWLAMKRGCEVGYVSFHSFPYIGEGSKKKVTDLVRELARWQPRSHLYVVPFADLQVAIRDGAPAPYRTVLYRRAMQRIASALAARHDYDALVTGESVGQVASQTLENMSCIAAAADRLVLRPLVSFDKEEAIAIARRIGTYEVSKRDEPDCCTVFQPDRPVIRGQLEVCLEAEAACALEPIIAAALAGVELIEVESNA